jgi:lysophospholipid acyltransferase (LPLAT)-like uncharacterized protein
MKKNLLKKLARSKVTHLAVAAILRAYFRTFTIERCNEAVWMAQVRSGGKVVLGFWHQHILGLLGYSKIIAAYDPLIMISASSDGDFTAGVVSQMGWRAVRGSSSRGGHTALLSMVRQLRRSSVMGHAVDGPRGPAGHIKPGLVHIAQSAGATIFPVLFEADKYWTAASWDQHLIPKPFSRVRIRFGEAFHCPRRFKNKVELEQYVQRLETIMRPCLVGLNLAPTKHNRKVPPISS